MHFLHKRLVGKTLAKVTAEPDQNVFGKVGCSAEAFQEALTGKKVLDARQQGKYFWYVNAIFRSYLPLPLLLFQIVRIVAFHINRFRSISCIFFGRDCSRN